MADSFSENTENQREYNELLEITTSLIGKVSDGMTNLQKQSDKRNKTLSTEIDMTKEILNSLEDEEDISEVINKLKSQSVNISEQNLGVNEKLKDNILRQIEATTGLLEKHQEVRTETEMIGEEFDNVTNSITGSLNQIVAMVGQIPILGGMLNSVIEPLFNSIGQSVTEIGTNLKEGFIQGYSAGRQRSMSYFKSNQLGIQGMKKSFSGLGPLLSNPYILAAAAAAALFAVAIAGFFQIEQSAQAFRETTGLLKNDTQDLSSNISDVVMDTAQLGVGFEDVQNAAVAFTQEFDNIDQASASVLKSMTVLNKNFGVSLETSAKVNKIFSSMSGKSSVTAQNMVQMVTEAADLVGVAPQKVLEDIAENSEVAFQFFGGSVSELASAAVEAEKLGTSIGEMASLADNLLDFESSINKELEVSALLGQRINLNRARSLAFEGDIAGAQEETLNQLDRIGDLTQLNRFEQQAIVDLTGQELSSLVRQQQIRSKFGELEKTQLAIVKERLAAGEEIGEISEEQLDREAEALEQRREIVNMFSQMGDVISGLGMQLITSLAPLAKGLFKPIMNAFSGIGEALDELFYPFQQMFGDGAGEGLATTLEVIGNLLGGVVAFGINLVANSLKIVSSLFAGVYDIIAGIINLDIEQIGDGFLNIGEAILRFFYKIPAVIVDTVLDAFQDTALGSLFGGSGADEKVDDGVIQNGKVISTNPADTLIATQSPEELRQEGGSGNNNKLIEEIKGLRNDLQSGKVAVYIDGKKATSAVSNVVDKIGTNSYAL